MYTRKTNKIQMSNERGQTMTEFALVLPVLALILFGIIQFGIVFNNYVTLTDAARAGARKAATGRRRTRCGCGRRAPRRSFRRRKTSPWSARPPAR